MAERCAYNRVTRLPAGHGEVAEWLKALPC